MNAQIKSRWTNSTAAVSNSALEWMNWMNEWKSLFIEGDSFSWTTNLPWGPHKTFHTEKHIKHIKD